MQTPVFKSGVYLPSAWFYLHSYLLLAVLFLWCFSVVAPLGTQVPLLYTPAEIFIHCSLIITVKRREDILLCCLFISTLEGLFGTAAADIVLEPPDSRHIVAFVLQRQRLCIFLTSLLSIAWLHFIKTMFCAVIFHSAYVARVRLKLLFILLLSVFCSTRCTWTMTQGCLCKNWGAGNYVFT